MLALIPTVFVANSQSSSDTIVLNKQHALKVLQAGLEGKVYKEQRDSLQSQIGTLNKLIEIKSLEIANLNSQTQDYKTIISKYESQVSVMTDQRKLLEAQATNLTKLYKKEARKKVFWKITTIIGLAGGILLGSKL